MPNREAAYLAIYGRSVGGSVRRYPTKRIKDQIRAQQRNCCLYCGWVIGVCVRRRGRMTQTRPAWDHFIPHSYSLRNSASNWVLACDICNGIKHADLYETVVAAQDAIKRRWRELGYEVVGEI